MKPVQTKIINTAIDKTIANPANTRITEIPPRLNHAQGAKDVDHRNFTNWKNAQLIMLHASNVIKRDTLQNFVSIKVKIIEIRRVIIKTNQRMQQQS